MNNKTLTFFDLMFFFSHKLLFSLILSAFSFSAQDISAQENLAQTTIGDPAPVYCKRAAAGTACSRLHGLLKSTKMGPPSLLESFLQNDPTLIVTTNTEGFYQVTLGTLSLSGDPNVSGGNTVLFNPYNKSIYIEVPSLNVYLTIETFTRASGEILLADIYYGLMDKMRGMREIGRWEKP